MPQRDKTYSSPALQLTTDSLDYLINLNIKINEKWRRGVEIVIFKKKDWQLHTFGTTVRMSGRGSSPGSLCGGS